MDNHIAVIGAGLAGATFARRMLDQGWKVTVFDKSRGTGGRLASCQVDDQSADLGAPWFEPESAAFREWLAQQPAVSHWQPHCESLSGGQITALDTYVHAPRQSALTRSLLAGAELITQTRVGYIWPETEGVIVRDEHGQPLGHFDSVVVTTPAPQAVPLLEAVPRFAQRAAEVNPTASWVLVVKLATPTEVKPNVYYGEHDCLQRLVRDSAKPGRGSADNSGTAETWVIEARDSWTHQHLETAPEQVADLLLSAFRETTGYTGEISAQRVHRWLYARQQPLSETGHLWSEETNIGVCGDWLHDGDSQGGLERAWHSANALAERLLNTADF